MKDDEGTETKRISNYFKNLADHYKKGDKGNDLAEKMIKKIDYDYGEDYCYYDVLKDMETHKLQIIGVSESRS